MNKSVLISAPKYYGIDTDIKDAFEALGFKTLLINHVPFTILESVASKIGTKLPMLKPIFNPILKASLIKENKEFLSVVSKERPDLLFIIKGDFVFPATLEKIKEVLSCPVVGYVWDEPFYTHNNNQDDYRKSNFKNCVLWYDFIFVFDTFYIDEIKRQGAKNVRYLPLATNPNRYSEITVTDQDRHVYAYDVCFIGLPFENRVEIFENLRNYKIGVFGDHWAKYFMLKGMKTPAYYKGKATGETVNKIYLSSKIVLNIHHPHSIEGLNTRTFDIPACGAFEIVDYKKNVEKHFEIDKEMVTFRNINELKSKTDFYLKNDDLRKTISERGKKRVLSEHTWVHRANEVITALK
ncbi:MAG: glycosyltransferase [Deltaproteobacteria bacterium]|nr:glycosyltransferase [Deltaproteobacteria bacterium]